MKPHSITLSEIAQQNSYDPVWALNNVRKSFVAHEGDLILGIPRLNGAGVDILRLEKTWLPIDLTAQVPRAQILQSTEFRKAIQENLLILIDDSSAQKILKSEGAEEERLRIDSEREYLRAATGVQPLAEDVAVTGSEPEKEEDDKNAQFKDWLHLLSSKNDTEVLADLKTRKITRKQARKLIAVLDPVKHVRSKNLLARALGK